MDVESWIAAGLLDPDDPGAENRLALLRYLASEGATLEEMVASHRDGNLTSLVTDLHLRRGALSAAELAQRAGIDVSRVVEVYRLLGVPITDADDQVFDEGEVRLLELLSAGGVALPEGVTDEILRALSSALAIVAESAVSAFVGSYEDSLEELGDELRRAEITTATGDLGLELGTLMGPLFRHHLRAAVARQRAAMGRATGRLDTELSIGFVDLVGFTATTATMASAELLEFMRRFHSRTYDVVTWGGGRVVKHIGDEIMFSAVDPTHGCTIGLDLIAEFGDEGSLPRGGLAHGTVVARHGDYYGPIVNLAARLADTAVPGELLADSRVADLLDVERFTVEPAGRRVLKGFADPVSVVSVRRREP